MEPQVRETLDNLVGDFVGLDEVGGLTTVEQMVLLLKVVFDKLEDLENHTHTLT